MPKLLHEALVELVRDAPAMVLRLLWPERQELAARVHVAAGEFVFNMNDFSVMGLVVSFLGAVILLAIVNLFKRGSVR